MTFSETFWAVLTATFVGQFGVWLFKRYIEKRLDKIHEEGETLIHILKRTLRMK